MVGLETVKKIDKNFLNTASNEELRKAVIALLDIVQQQALQIEALSQQVLDLENENRILKGEKKSRIFAQHLKGLR